MDYRIIKSPTAGTLDILARRTGITQDAECRQAAAVGLVQGKMIEMIVAADIAEKAVGVTVRDVRGSCPQNMILIAIFGDTASVESAMQEIRRKMQEEGGYVC
ncbi:BMC domain-containing protein [Clostridium minihomine]|uniref:BMC domain-containing protein n=1 Tax=Clostridium minihomine TaxID=2045012 RepID=UPI000C76F0BB|nr:BMC domain-containing protein [Clostridium minihomine]